MSHPFGSTNTRPDEHALQQRVATPGARPLTLTTTPPAGNSSTTSVDSERAKHVKGQVDEVVGIMRSNIDRVLERGENLSTIQTKTDDLQQGALQFRRGANTVRRNLWWQNMKMNFIIALVVVIIIVAVVLMLAVPMRQEGGSDGAREKSVKGWSDRPTRNTTLSKLASELGLVDASAKPVAT